MWWISNSEFIASVQKSIELAPMMSAEKHKVESVGDGSQSERSLDEEEKSQIGSLKENEDGI